MVEALSEAAVPSHPRQIPRLIGSTPTSPRKGDGYGSWRANFGHCVFMGNFCTNCGCVVSEITNVPGTPGTPGAAGANGQNAFTLTTANFNLPAANSNVTVAVASSIWMAVGQNVIVSDGTNLGNFQVVSFPSVAGVVLKWLNYPGDSVTGTTINSGATVSPAGIVTPLASGLPAALTDNTGGTPGAALAVGVGESLVTFPLTSLATDLGTGAVTALNGYKPGFNFEILQFDFVNTIPGTGAGATQTFNLSITGTGVTGGSVNPTLASTGTYGNITAGSTITGTNTGGVTDTLEIALAAGGTVFTAGAGYFVMRIKNMDTANALASLNTSVNSLIAALT